MCTFRIAVVPEGTANLTVAFIMDGWLMKKRWILLLWTLTMCTLCWSVQIHRAMPSGMVAPLMENKGVVLISVKTSGVHMWSYAAWLPVVKDICSREMNCRKSKCCFNEISSGVGKTMENIFNRFPSPAHPGLTYLGLKFHWTIAKLAKY